MNRATLTAFASGLLFGSGLVLAGMTTPANILDFLDIAGAWNPALALVMASAIAVAAPAFALVRRRHRHTGLAAPARASGLDRRLVGGSLLFGVGWGLSGICPGPGLVLAAAGSGSALVFVAAMAAGMLLARRVSTADATTPAAASAPDRPAGATTASPPPAAPEGCG